MTPVRRMQLLALAALPLTGCGDHQSVLNPKGPEALQLAQLSWFLFAVCTFVLVVVVVAAAAADPRTCRCSRHACFASHGGVGRHRLSRRYADRSAHMRRLADARRCDPGRRAWRAAHYGRRRAVVVACPAILTPAAPSRRPTRSVSPPAARSSSPCNPRM